MRTITDKIRRATDREGILAAAQKEISQMLGASQTAVRLGTQQQLLRQIVSLKEGAKQNGDHPEQNNEAHE